MTERTVQEIADEFVESELKRFLTMNPEELSAEIEQRLKALKESHPHIWSQISWVFNKEELEEMLKKLENEED